MPTITEVLVSLGKKPSSSGKIDWNKFLPEIHEAKTKGWNFKDISDAIAEVTGVSIKPQTIGMKYRSELKKAMNQQSVS